MRDPSTALVDHGRVYMAKLAKWLDKVFEGKLRPAHITLLSLLGHIPIAWALIEGQPTTAAILLVIFGGMDALDGALARVQKSESTSGMFLDAVTDRMKEIILYIGLSVYIFNFTDDSSVWLVVAVAGTSLLVSYIKAKGEMAVAKNRADSQKLNREFSNGFGRYEIRMALVVAGLLTGLISPLLRFIVAINLFTIAARFTAILSVLNSESGSKNAKG